MRKKMAAAVLMAAMTASLLAGCGDSKSSDSTKADSAQTTASNQSEAGDSTSDLKEGKTECGARKRGRCIPAADQHEHSEAVLSASV